MKINGFFRKALLSSLALTMLNSGCSSGIGMPPDTQTFRNALSVSPFTEIMFRSGYSYEDELGNKAQNLTELQELFIKHGANEVFVRIATARQRYSLESADHSLQNGVEMAKLAAKLNLPLNPEIGLFKYYGDVTGQPGPDFSEYPEIVVPKPWEQLNIDEMATILKQYGTIVARELTATGAKINTWDIGNEVNFGIAGVSVQPLPGAMDAEMGANWYQAPDAVNPEIGKQSVYTLLTMGNADLIKWAEVNLWPYQAKLMNALREGILTVDPKARFSTHITFPTNTDYAVAFFKALDKNGFQLDVAGLSFYPSASPEPRDRFAAFKATVDAIYEETKLPVFIAEYAYPAYAPDYFASGPYKDWNNKAGNYEMDAEGQAALLRDMTSWGVAHHVVGIRPWAPELVMFGWQEFSMFSVTDLTAKALPVIDSITNGLKEAEPAELKD